MKTNNNNKLKGKTVKHRMAAVAIVEIVRTTAIVGLLVVSLG
jgi:hypothetical protein